MSASICLVNSVGCNLSLLPLCIPQGNYITHLGKWYVFSCLSHCANTKAVPTFNVSTKVWFGSWSAPIKPVVSESLNLLHLIVIDIHQSLLERCSGKDVLLPLCNDHFKRFTHSNIHMPQRVRCLFFYISCIFGLFTRGGAFATGAIFYIFFHDGQVSLLHKLQKEPCK